MPRSKNTSILSNSSEGSGFSDSGSESSFSDCYAPRRRRRAAPYVVPSRTSRRVPEAGPVSQSLVDNSKVKWLMLGGAGLAGMALLGVCFHFYRNCNHMRAVCESQEEEHRRQLQALQHQMLLAQQHASGPYQAKSFIPAAFTHPVQPQAAPKPSPYPVPPQQQQQPQHAPPAPVRQTAFQAPAPQMQQALKTVGDFFANVQGAPYVPLATTPTQTQTPTATATPPRPAPVTSIQQTGAPAAAAEMPRNPILDMVGGFMSQFMGSMNNECVDTVITVHMPQDESEAQEPRTRQTARVEEVMVEDEQEEPKQPEPKAAEPVVPPPPKPKEAPKKRGGAGKKKATALPPPPPSLD